MSDHIVKHMNSNGLFTKYQHGLMGGRSRSTNLLASLDVWSKSVENRIPVDTIYLDFAKAFNDCAEPSYSEQTAWLWNKGENMHMD